MPRSRCPNYFQCVSPSCITIRAIIPGVTDPDDLEFIELLNTGSQTVSLAGVQLAQFATPPYTFGSGINLAAGERIVVARTPAVFQSVYGTGIQLAPVGYADANLSNGGERLQLIGPFGELLQDFTYDDIAPWPTSPDGGGRSLEIIDPLGDPANPANWRASAAIDGSPGAEGNLPIPGDYDGNGTVEQSDYSFWRMNFGSTVPAGTGADGNGDGSVDAADYVIWRKNLGMSPAGGAALSSIEDSLQPVDGSTAVSMPAVLPERAGGRCRVRSGTNGNRCSRIGLSGSDTRQSSS